MFLFTHSACVKDDISTSLNNPQAAALDGKSKPTSQLQTALVSAVAGGGRDNVCNCQLQVVDAYSPVPPGGSGGFLGLSFYFGYWGPGQSSYVFGAYVSDCILGFASLPTWYVQVPSGNTPTYPSSYLSFLYGIPAFQSFNMYTPDVAWFNNDGCEYNSHSDNDYGYLKVRLRCCDSIESECQQCYYSDVIEVGINTANGGGGSITPLSLKGDCGCEPEAD